MEITMDTEKIIEYLKKEIDRWTDEMAYGLPFSSQEQKKEEMKQAQTVVNVLRDIKIRILNGHFD
jgi:hypothetical protein